MYTSAAPSVVSASTATASAPSSLGRFQRTFRVVHRSFISRACDEDALGKSRLCLQQLRAVGSGRFEQVDRASRGGESVRSSSTQPQHQRESAEAFALRPSGSDSSPDGERMALRRERSLEIVRELRLTSMALKNVSQARLVHPLAEAQRGCEMLRRRPMRTQLCCAVAGDRRQLEHSECGPQSPRHAWPVDRCP